MPGSQAEPLSKASFRTQAKALFRKNASYQARNRRTNIRIFAIPVGFCVLLAILQVVVNNALDSDSNKCGCKCLYCCDNRSGTDVCKTATDADPCVPGQYSSCKQQDKTQCGLVYSTGEQSRYCAISQPASWPAFLQIPEEPFRIQPYRPAAAMFYTGQDRGTADSIAGFMFAAPDLSNAAEVAQAASLLSSGSNSLGQGLQVGEAFSGLGFTFGTPSSQVYNFYLEPAFVNATAIFNVVPSCGSDTTTAALNAFVEANNAGSQLFSLPFNCTAGQPVWAASSSGIENTLYCGYKQSRCSSVNGFVDIEGVGQAFDFGATDRQRLQLRVWYNDTAVLQAGQQPPPISRVNKAINLAANAYLKYNLGPQYSAVLEGVMDVPKPGSKVTLDFSSLLGPLFFCWLLELLIPVIVDQLVTEKQRGLRIMMKMHGLGDAAYWSVQYVWYTALYLGYMFVLIGFGSAINLKFFRLTEYGFTIVFFILWGNTMVSSSFLASVFFTNPKTALVSCYLYVFATGLLGSLLLGTYMGLDYWWCNLAEVVPAFALYRGLYIMGQYAFKGAFQGSGGFTFSDFNSDGNGMAVVFIILVVEWIVFLVLAVYLEQVLASGTGVRRHPLFFLPSFRSKRRGSTQAKLPAAQESKAPVAVASSRRLSGGFDDKVPLPDVNIHPEESEDVAAERVRVEQLSTYDDQAIVTRDLSKIYPAQDGNPAKVAVRSLTLAVAKGECFGLLGPNGAGKSSAINMLNGLQEPTSGDARVEGLSILEDMSSIYSRMGVCPQHDLLWDMLTPTEHLLFFGRLKNLEEKELRVEIEKGLKSVNLWANGLADKRVGQFSGGMKRRLSVAISLIGRPAVVYMDEPSTGLDPASRRNLWEVVKTAKRGRGIILTTHSMEEAEVLCDRLGIFVDGRLICVGNPKELTSRYGGYLVFTITTPPSEVHLAEQLVRVMAPHAVQSYSLGGTLKYELPSAEVSIGGVFAAMEEARGRLTVLDWGVANCTLEEVFIKFARSLGVEGGA